jgi:hypothetical protein
LRGHGRATVVQRTAPLPLAYARPSTSLAHKKQDVDARDKRGHYELGCGKKYSPTKQLLHHVIQPL